MGGRGLESYTYDADSETTGETDYIDGQTLSPSYQYSSLGQLISGGNGSYAYGPAGNPTTIAGTSGYVYSGDQLTSAPANPALGTPAVAIAYDGPNRASVTPTSGVATDYSYNALNQLTGMTQTGASPASETNTYDGNGLLQTQNTGSGASDLTWDTQGQLPLLMSKGAWNIIYGPDDLPIEQIGNIIPIVYVYHHDAQGSTRLLTSTTGAAVGTDSYGPYGNVTSSTGTKPILGYDGQYTDPTTGLIYLRARWYDPETAQFLTADPLQAITQQAYNYADDDPISNTDPSGLLTVGGCWSTNGTFLSFFGELSVCAQVSSSGDVGASATVGGGPGGVGGDFITGPSVEISNASNISQLDGPFIQGGAGVADGLGAFGSGFASLPGACNPGYGGSLGPALGVGAAGYAGGSETVTANVNPVHTVEHWIAGLAGGLASLNPFG